MAFTFFFRDQHVLDLVIKHVVPTMAGLSRIRVWDAGCAMGQEPYSVAIWMAKHMSHFAFNNLKLLATDLESASTFGAIVREGVYGHEELERLPEGILATYFEVEPDRPGHYRVIERIRSRVEFRQHDLLTLQEPAQGFCLVVCKNVLLHFQASEREQVIRMFHRALAPDGWLVMEQTQKLPPALAPLFRQASVDGQVYQKVNVG
jgi:chemotaxis protein methyltransferase CheR